MGNCKSAVATDTKTKHIDSTLAADRSSIRREVKMLLLGTGESGKSTIFKQMRLIHNTGFLPAERMEMVPVIRKHTIECFVGLVQAAVFLDVMEDHVKTEAEGTVGRLQTDGMCEEFAPQVLKLWATNSLQLAYQKRAVVQITDSANHFIENYARLASATYVPTDEDLLLCRVRTTGISETLLGMDGVTVRLVDVGGQRSERRKWIHCFEDVHAVIFVCAINEYDQLLFEDNKTNRMLESLRLFAEVCNSRFFSGAAKIIFLNKKDLFEEKIKNVPLSTCFPEYQGSNTMSEAVDFLREKFSKAYNGDASQLYIHTTCATSAGNVRFVFESVRENVLLSTFGAAGLL